ncbi:methyltransferase MtaB domain-containing protein [Clostridium sp. MT-14]|jgi:methanol--5-hydroxybenzimidazolylcobamide Co-methyltransferase|uniref:methyltransferase MtaB domain-containing protein n=1 Tax=unclassified Clostridium TaxID=2614128 RepID=UPI00123B327E|nr:methyltransferase MtaB domain-containing protein [Clostridium sp. HV4-5-A1G]KAA8667371.1 hypothetical protein F3O63_15720 [Clostridium sp. HV4-5-A1G]
MNKKFNRLAYSSLKDFIYGVAKNPVTTKNGLVIGGVLKRAKELYCKGLVVELELLPPMTVNPEWGIEINKIVRDAMDEIRKAIDNKEVYIEDREYKWLDIMSDQLENIPENEQEFWYKIKQELNLNNFIPSEYDLKID